MQRYNNIYSFCELPINKISLEIGHLAVAHLQLNALDNTIIIWFCVHNMSHWQTIAWLLFLFQQHYVTNLKISNDFIHFCLSWRLP